MKIQNVLSVLSVLIVSTQAIEGLRGGDARFLEDYNNDDNVDVDSQGDDAYSNSTAVANETQTAAAGNLTDTMHQIQDIVVNQVEQYKSAAATKGYEFYATAPSEWTSAQWDFVTALLGGLILTCCFFSVCCAYCCIYRTHDDETNEAITKAQYHKRMLNQRLNRHRARYNERRYKRESPSDEDDDTIDDTVYTLESQSTYGQSTYAPSYYEPDTPTVMSYESSVYINKREQRRREKEEKKKREQQEREARKEAALRKRERDEKKEALLKKENDEKREALLKKEEDEKREALLNKEEDEKRQALLKEEKVEKRMALLKKEKEAKRQSFRETLAKKTDGKVPQALSPVSMSRVETERPTSSRSVTPIRSTRSSAAHQDKHEQAGEKSVQEALSYKMHP